MADTFHYDNTEFATEQDMVLHLVDHYRCIEEFASRYLSAWLAVAGDPQLRGGLRIVCGRERTHAGELDARLRELGGAPARQMPADRLPDVAFYGSREHTDDDKLARVAARLEGHDVLAPIEAAIAQIRTDAETRELLLQILDDERASIRWLLALRAARG